jgi:hypothetical protein
MFSPNNTTLVSFTQADQFLRYIDHRADERAIFRSRGVAGESTYDRYGRASAVIVPVYQVSVVVVPATTERQPVLATARYAVTLDTPFDWRYRQVGTESQLVLCAENKIAAARSLAQLGAPAADLKALNKTSAKTLREIIDRSSPTDEDVTEVTIRQTKTGQTVDFTIDPTKNPFGFSTVRLEITRVHGDQLAYTLVWDVTEVMAARVREAEDAFRAAGFEFLDASLSTTAR